MLQYFWPHSDILCYVYMQRQREKKSRSRSHLDFSTRNLQHIVVKQFHIVLKQLTVPAS